MFAEWYLQTDILLPWKCMLSLNEHGGQRRKIKEEEEMSHRGKMLLEKRMWRWRRRCVAHDQLSVKSYSTYKAPRSSLGLLPPPSGRWWCLSCGCNPAITACSHYHVLPWWLLCGMPFSPRLPSATQSITGREGDRMDPPSFFHTSLSVSTRITKCIDSSKFPKEFMEFQKRIKTEAEPISNSGKLRLPPWASNAPQQITCQEANLHKERSLWNPFFST